MGEEGVGVGYVSRAAHPHHHQKANHVLCGSSGSGAEVIVTVLETILPVFPATSTYLYQSSYVPGTKILTIPENGDHTTPVPSTPSIHVAPFSV